MARKISRKSKGKPSTGGSKSVIIRPSFNEKGKKQSEKKEVRK